MAYRRIVLLLPGQGTQRERMAVGLYRTEPVFTEHMDRILRALGPAGREVRDEWLRAAPNAALDDGQIAQPLLFAVGYALGRTVLAWDAPPAVLLGHSVGELACACLAGVFDPEDGAALMRARGTVLRGAGGGGMLAVAASPGQCAALAGAEVSVAAVNGPRQTVLSGPAEALAAAGERLRTAGFTVRALRSSHAFHHPRMAEAAERLATVMAELRLRPPAGEIHSSRTARAVRPHEAVDGCFWAGQLALPVLYWPALRALLDANGTFPGLLLLDASPDRSLSAPARRHPAVQSGGSAVVPLLPAASAGTAEDLETLRSAREATVRWCQAAAS